MKVPRPRSDSIGWAWCGARWRFRCTRPSPWRAVQTAPLEPGCRSGAALGPPHSADRPAAQELPQGTTTPGWHIGGHGQNSIRRMGLGREHLPWCGVFEVPRRQGCTPPGARECPGRRRAMQPKTLSFRGCTSGKSLLGIDPCSIPGQGSIRAPGRRQSPNPGAAVAGLREPRRAQASLESVDFSHRDCCPRSIRFAGVQPGTSSVLLSPRLLARPGRTATGPAGSSTSPRPPWRHAHWVHPCLRNGLPSRVVYPSGCGADEPRRLR